MGKYFGTDGFRGEAGVNLTADHAYKVGRFLGWYYNALRIRLLVSMHSFLSASLDLTTIKIIIKAVRIYS